MLLFHSRPLHGLYCAQLRTVQHKRLQLSMRNMRLVVSLLLWHVYVTSGTVLIVKTLAGKKKVHCLLWKSIRKCLERAHMPLLYSVALVMQ